MRLLRRRSGVWWRGCRAPPQKNVSFCSQNDKFMRILLQFLTGRKHGSLWDTDFTVQSRNYKAYKTVKIIPKFMVRPRGAVAPSPPEYATALNTIFTV